MKHGHLNRHKTHFKVMVFCISQHQPTEFVVQIDKDIVHYSKLYSIVKGVLITNNEMKKEIASNLPPFSMVGM